MIQNGRDIRNAFAEIDMLDDGFEKALWRNGKGEMPLTGLSGNPD